MIHVPFSRTFNNFVKVKRIERDIKSSNWCFSVGRFSMIEHEGDDWEKCYLPVDLKGKVVLDVGAGEGETAKLFLEHGASKVICVECDSNCLVNLRVNARVHSGIEVIARRFHVSDLFMFEFDFMKMDIEGYEECVLSRVLPKPSVIEIHGLQLRDRFVKAGFRVGDHFNMGNWCCYGYWGC